MFRRVDEIAFRRIVLVVLLSSGLSLFILFERRFRLL
jgi:hypothetical protein